MFVSTVSSLVGVQRTIVTDAALDAFLSRIAKEKDKEALSQLYHATSTSVYAYALSILKNAQEAEDVLQDCYLCVFSSAHTYRSMGKPLAWMMSITKNLCLQRLREQQRVSDIPEEEWEEYLEADTDLSPENRVVLKECMKVLNESEREIIVLHAVAGFKHREIANVLDLPISTVLSKYNRAIKKLKEALVKGDYEYGK